jgi:hypothetical protein
MIQLVFVQFHAYEWEEKILGLFHDVVRTLSPFVSNEMTVEALA